MDVSQQAENLEFYLISHYRDYLEGWRPDPYILLTRQEHIEAARELEHKGRAIFEGNYVMVREN